MPLFQTRRIIILRNRETINRDRIQEPVSKYPPKMNVTTTAATTTTATELVWGLYHVYD